MGNEMVSTMWSSFFSFFLMEVAGVSGSIIGTALLIGQVMGGVMAPVTSFLVSVVSFGRFG
jgi:Na+/melibiose symporter-like transporter